jgi:pyruvate dehydrogenase E2 component (dihydrolipoamide acetyltransferase)
VRQLARRAGIDPATLVGTGRDGLITRADVERAIAARAAPAAEPEGVDRRTGLPVRTRVPLTGVRGHIARTLTRSRAEIPEATTWVDVDATALLTLREDMRHGDWKPGLLVLLARFVVAGLRAHPALNSRVDVEREEVVHLDGVNLGVAAQTERGLVVPAVRGADRLSIRGLDTEIRRLTAAAREGTATAAELSSGSFTLNNYGVFGVDGSAAIINHPEAAILGIGRIHPRPWVVDGAVVPRQITQLSLVFDHRVCDGGTAAGFLRFVADAVEAPLRTVVDL